MPIDGKILSVTIDGRTFYPTEGAELSMNPDKPLTEKQRATLGFVETYITAHGGKAPTFQEIANHFGLSVHAVDMRLRQLRQRGLIDWKRNTPRSIVLLQPESEAPIANG